MMKNTLKILLFLSVTIVSVGHSEPYSSSSEGTYYLQSPLNFGLDLHYVYFRMPAIKDGRGVVVALEYLPMTNYGKFGLGLSAGAVALEQATLAPLGFFLSYRADYFINQILVPFAKVGPSWNLTANYPGRKEVSGTWALDYSAGVELCLSALDRGTQRGLDNSTGINTTYLVFEYVSTHSVEGSRYPDPSKSEFRFGLRFEI